MAHFNRERIPERVVHAKGHGAFGFFEATEDVTRYTRANFLSGRASAHRGVRALLHGRRRKGLGRRRPGPRGFALKFYTEEGNYDLVGNNTPVFFIRDPSKFSDFIHSQKRGHPAAPTLDPHMFWDFCP